MSIHYQNSQRHHSHRAPPARPPSSQYAPPPQDYYGSAGYGYAEPPPGRHSVAPSGPPAPPGADPQLWQWFSAVDTDRSGAISVAELQTALVNGNWTKFDLDTVKMLMSIFDTNHSGSIQYHEFAGLWKYIEDWQNVFRHFDQDRSGSIEGRELANALDQFGYRLSPSLLSLLEKKYASGPVEVGGYGSSPGITFDRFVRACVVVKTLTEAFQRIDTDRDGWVQVNYEQFMNVVLSAP